MRRYLFARQSRRNIPHVAIPDFINAIYKRNRFGDFLSKYLDINYIRDTLIFSPEMHLISRMDASKESLANS